MHSEEIRRSGSEAYRVYVEHRATPQVAVLGAKRARPILRCKQNRSRKILAYFVCIQKSLCYTQTQESCSNRVLQER